MAAGEECGTDVSIHANPAEHRILQTRQPLLHFLASSPRALFLCTAATFDCIQVNAAVLLQFKIVLFIAKWIPGLEAVPLVQHPAGMVIDFATCATDVEDVILAQGSVFIEEGDDRPLQISNELRGYSIANRFT